MDTSHIAPLPDPEEMKKESDFMTRFVVIVEKAMIMKKNMQSRKLNRAAALCLFCPGKWQARLAGAKEHIWIHCDNADESTRCNTRFME